MTKILKGYQLKYLRSLAHRLKPVLLIGQKGATAMVALALEDALNQHELIKIKFIEGKAKAEKEHVIESLKKATQAYFVGMIGHTVIFFRPHPDKEKRRISLPQRPSMMDDQDNGAPSDP